MLHPRPAVVAVYSAVRYLNYTFPGDSRSEVPRSNAFETSREKLRCDEQNTKIRIYIVKNIRVRVIIICFIKISLEPTMKDQVDNYKIAVKYSR